MKLFAILSTLVVSVFALSFGSLATITGATTQSPVVSAQEDCKDGETWNDEKKSCEKAEDGK